MDNREKNEKLNGYQSEENRAVTKARTERRAGHFWADNEVLDVYGRDIGAYGLAVYMVLARHARNESGRCTLSTRKIAGSLNVSTSTVRKSLEVLKREGLIRIDTPENKHGHVPTSYELLAVKKSGRCPLSLVSARQPQLSVGRPQVSVSRPPNKEAILENSKTNTTSSAKEEEQAAINAVYEAYPRHVGKIEAFKAIEKAVGQLFHDKDHSFSCRLEALSFLEKRARLFAGSVAGQRGHMTPHPATWFARGRYLDDPNEWDYLNDSELKEARNRMEAIVGVYRPI